MMAIYGINYGSLETYLDFVELLVELIILMKKILKMKIKNRKMIF